ncbi:MAG: endonuclease [Ktedonobacteraceae bacterium]
MSSREGLSQWEHTVSSHLPQLSRPQAAVLALWSYGMVLAKSCGITSVVALLAPLLGQSEATVRQRLREWCYDAVDKKGAQRHDLEVSRCFAPLLGWILSWWTPGEQRLALAMDASSLSDRFTVLCISVVYRGCAIPVAWKIVIANEKGAWEPYWKALFAHLAGSVPADWTVLVLADRGLYAKWLYELIVDMHWPPFLRINRGGKVRPQGEASFDWLSTLVPQVGSSWCGQVECFVEVSQRLQCTLLACWEAGYADPWLVLTDLPAEAANVVWYSMRTWVEAGFKDTKRGGWQWHQTKMSDPARASRLWLAIAVATLWVVSVGGQADAALPCSSLEALPELHVARRRASKRSRPRLHSCFARGVRLILVALLQGEPLPFGRFIPEPWPSTLPPRKKTQPKKKKKKSKGKGNKGNKGKQGPSPAASKAAA